MAYSPGDVLTAANLNGITGASNSYGSAATVWTASGTNPAIGNGTFTAKFRQDVKWVDFFVQITMGSTTTYGTGTWVLALPVTARFSGWGITGRAIDSSAGTIGFPVTADCGTTSVTLRCAATTAGNADRVLSSTNPFAWATGDVLTITGRYEAA